MTTIPANAAQVSELDTIEVPALLTRREAAGLFKVSLRTIDKWLAAGDMTRAEGLSPTRITGHSVADFLTKSGVPARAVNK